MKQQSLIRTGLVPVLAACLASCVSVGTSNHYTVSGTVQDTAANGKTIYILRYDDNARIDSTTVQDGKFTFIGSADTAHFCYIDVNRSEYANFILEPGFITVDLQAHDAPSGTPLNEGMARLVRQSDSLSQMVRDSAEYIHRTCTDPDERKAQLRKLIAHVTATASKSAWQVYPPQSNTALGYYFYYTPLYDMLTLDEKQKLLDIAGPWLRSTRLHRRQTQTVKAQQSTAEGRPFADLSLVDPAGQPDSLSHYVGRDSAYTLVDFYATWCGPCKEEQPRLEGLHRQFGGRGLTVVGICMWDREANFRRALEQKKDTYVHLFDANETAEATYGIEGVPQILLIGPDGTILHRDLRGDAMVRTVTKLMQTK